MSRIYRDADIAVLFHEEYESYNRCKRRSEHSLLAHGNLTFQITVAPFSLSVVIIAIDDRLMVDIDLQSGRNTLILAIAAGFREGTHPAICLTDRLPQTDDDVVPGITRLSREH